MRRHSFLSSHKFLVIVIYTLALIVGRDGVVRSQCEVLSGNRNLNRVFGYYTANSSPQPQNYINSTALTHLNYVVPDFSEFLASSSPISGGIYDIELRELVNFRGNGTWQNGNGSILLSIPLSSLNQAELSGLLSNNSEFVTNVIAFVASHSLNGVDLEFPNKCTMSGDGNNNGFMTLSNDLYMKLKSHNSSNILTITIGPWSQVGSFPRFDSSNFDFINIMAYQLNLNTTSGVSLNSPSSDNSLQQTSYQSVFNNFNKLNIIQPERINFGVDFGGIVELCSLKNTTPNNFNISNMVRRSFDNNSFLGGLQPWDDTCSPNSRSYTLLWSFRWIVNETLSDSSLCAEETNGWTRILDDISQEPYTYKNFSNQYLFVSYEDQQSINKKINWAINNGYGIAIADLSKDTDDLAMLNAIGTYFPHDSSQSPLMPTSTPNTTGPLFSSESSKTSNAGLIAGVVGGFALILILSSLIIVIIKKRRHENEMSLKPSENRSSPLIPPATVILTTAEPTTNINFVTALFDFEGKEDGDLSFKKGDRIEVIERGNGPVDWWVGKVNGVVGEFPGNYVRE